MFYWDILGKLALVAILAWVFGKFLWKADDSHILRRVMLILIFGVLFSGWIWSWGMAINFYIEPSTVLVWFYGISLFGVFGLIGYLIWLHFLK